MGDIMFQHASTPIRGSALFACAFAIAAFGSSPVAAKSINTVRSWDGTSYVQPFGCPDTTTYGQVITVPQNETSLNKFTFRWINLNTGSMVVRGEVYAWDGTKATGSALWESSPKKIQYPDFVFHKRVFNPGSIAVTPGAQYVLFASIDKDYEKCTNGYELGWGLVTSGDAYPGGFFVYQNNSGDESQWTTTAWSTFNPEDVAFHAFFSP
jgi:hypothetical protein